MFISVINQLTVNLICVLLFQLQFMRLRFKSNGNRCAIYIKLENVWNLHKNIIRHQDPVFGASLYLLDSNCF